MATRADPRYLGRDAETQFLDAAIEQATAGRLTSVVVEGEAGIGKSRLLSESLATARDRGREVAWGRADELERSRPFGVLVDAFGCSASSSDPRRSGIADLLTAQVGNGAAMTVTSDPGLQFRVVDAFVDLVEAEALGRPLVIAVDDLQWADPSSLLTLNALNRRLTFVPVGVLACMRPAPRGSVLGRMVDRLVAGGARRLALGQLGQHAVTGLVAEAAGAEPGPGLLAHVAAAGGNPLFVGELVSALIEEGAIEVIDGQAEVAEMTVPPTLRLTILRRLSFLSAETLDLLRSASILGSSFTLAELSTVTGRPAFDLSALLDGAFKAGVLTDDGAVLRFRHDLIRAAVYADLPHSVRIGLHREAGQHLARSGAPALRVAEHLVRSAEPGDTDAVVWLTKAARESASTSPGIAADLLHRAIGLTDSSAADTDALVVERATFLLWAGRIPEAETVCRAVLSRPHDPTVGTLVRICLGSCLLATGRMRDALHELELVYRSPTATEAQRAESRAWASIVAMSLGHLDNAAALAEQALSAAAHIGDDATSSLALTTLAGVEELRGHFRDALGIADQAVRHADDSVGRHGHRYPHHLDRAQVLMQLDRFGDARATLETGMRVSEQLGMPWQLAAYQTAIAVERFTAGEWDDALSAFEAGLKLAEEETGVLGTFVLGHSVMSLIALHRNDLERAEQAASAAAAAREVEDSYARYHGHWSAKAQALLLEADSAIPEAFAMLARCWDECDAAGLAVELPVLGPDLVRLALAASEPGRADQVTSTVATIAATNDVPSLTGAALRCQGLRDGDPDALRRAVDTYAQIPRPLELAQTCEEASAALARVGAVEAAVEYLDRALASYGRLDAARDAARTQSALRRLGVRRGRRGPRKRPRTGWGSLTATERTVADLVAEGLSNPQIGDRLFVSRRTVQTHLAHVFQKLQISSRTELAAAVTRQRGAN